MSNGPYDLEPMLISGNYAYYVESVGEESLLVKYSYKILSQLP